MRIEDVEEILTEKFGVKVYDVKDDWTLHTYHKYFVFPNLYALSVMQGFGAYSHDDTFEVALGKVKDAEDYESFELAFKGDFSKDVLGWQSPEKIIKLAENILEY